MCAMVKAAFLVFWNSISWRMQTEGNTTGAEYGEHEASIAIEDGSVLGGSLPQVKNISRL